MIKPPRQTMTAPYPASALLLAAVLAGIPGSAAASDYPPPPGSYRSEPAVLPELPQQPSPPRTSAAPGAASPETTGPSSAQPAPGTDGGSSEAGRYNAENLFGSAPPARPQISDQRITPQEAPGYRPPEPAFTPRAYPTDPYPAQNGFGMGLSPAGQPAPFTGGYYGQGTPFYQGQPQYAPGYPGYQQYPGQMMEYAPPAAEPGYYAPAQAYPQEQYPAGNWPGQGMTEPATAMPLFYPMTDPELQNDTGAGATDSGELLFRPPEMLPAN